ncbi:outer membrane beta-barrel protein [Marinifilum caeruleilacunae]|uniref:PorT family protein n=1 Tax=Marinifilum caeruleilacunae TaxID=2499076 RepID=A0ABX1WRX7_9BACT|nr:outer membrane beta-barrel protein [Marinifilum caeruleilacunae]NOU58843.1 PorT family protein [Marinifilum caeruleilacunae]
MKKHFIVLFVLLSLLTFSSFAQGDFRIGYIVTSNGDTIKGEIAYTLKSKNYKSCTFKQGESITKYSPAELKIYSIDGIRAFASGIVPDFFVETLIEGEISLYKKDLVYYVQKNGGEIHILEQYLKDKEVKTENKRWKGIMLFLVKDRLEGQVNSKNFRFSEKYLTELVRKYNIKGGKEYTETKADIPWAITHYGAVGGVNIHRFYLDEAKTSSYIDDFNHTSPFIGLYYNISSPRLSEKFSFQIEAQLCKLDAKGTSFYGTYKEHFIKTTKLSIPLGLKYDLHTKKLNWHALAGFVADINFNIDHYTMIYRTNDLNTEPEELLNFFSTDKSQIGLWAGMGVEKKFKKFNARFDFRYNKLSSILYDRQQVNFNEDRFSFVLILSK